MIGMDIRSARQGFFDRKRVRDSMSAADRKAQSRLGAGVRADAQRSIKYEDGPSSPGAPPHGHRTGSRLRRSRSKKTPGALVRQAVSPLREFIYFARDAGANETVIGPVRLPNKTGDAPRALEYGGMSLVVRRGKKARAAVRARPFMRPALAGQLANLPEAYGGSMR